jgi:single-stranded-DNA-specific exonuclease
MARLLRSAWRLNPAVPETGPFAERILAGRGLVSPQAVQEFLHPSIERLQDPFLLPDMEKACSLIINALREKKTVMIHGDYDVDGITATALLVRFLNQARASCLWMIPDRTADGYGLSAAGAEKIIGSGASLLITADCGIANLEEIRRLNQAGVKVIVTDHHECPPQLPEAEAIINPKRPDSACPFPHLAGVGVALKLTQALSMRLGLGDLWQAGLELAALGTVADVVPLLDENRILVFEGLKRIPGQRLPGLAALLNTVGQAGRAVTSQTLGFAVAPRINAAGRLGSASRALDLLLTDDPAEAGQIAAELADLNRQRQDLESGITAEAIREIDSHFDFTSRDMVIVAREGWHQGVVGIVAARLADHYGRPVIVFSGEDGYFKGSGRSAGDFNLYEAIGHAARHVVKYGGHRKAAGVMIEAGEMDHFRQAVNEYARMHLSSAFERPVIQAEMETQPDQLTMDRALAIQKLEPFGEENPQPLMILRKMTIKTIRQAGNGRHVKLQLATENTSEKSTGILEGIAFGQPEADELYKAGDQVDLVFSLEINNWQGVPSVQLNIRDLAYSRTDNEFADSPWIADSLYRGGSSMQTLMRLYGLPLKALRPVREEYKYVYQFIRSHFGERPVLADLALLAGWIARSYGTDFNMFRLSRILAVFEEIRLVSLQPVGEDRVLLEMVPAGEKVQLEASLSFRNLEAEEVGG